MPAPDALLPEARRHGRRRRVRIVVLLAAVLGLGAALVSVLGPPSGPDQPAASGRSGPVAGAGGTAAARACAPWQLRLTSDRSGWHADHAAGGQFAETLTFVDASTRPCTLSGWPSVQAEASGTARPTVVVRVSQRAAQVPKPAPVHLAPGGAASFAIYAADWNAVDDTACPQASGYAVTLPGDSASLAVHAVEPDCGTVYVAPLVAGRVDRGAWSTVVGTTGSGDGGGAGASAG